MGEKVLDEKERPVSASRLEKHPKAFFFFFLKVLSMKMSGGGEK